MNVTMDREQEQTVTVFSHASTSDDYRALEGLHLGLALLDSFDPSAEGFVPLGEDLLNRFLRGSPSPGRIALALEEKEKKMEERRAVGPELLGRMSNIRLPWAAKLQVHFRESRSASTTRPRAFVTVGARAARRLELLKAIRDASALTADGEAKEIKYWRSAHVWAVFQVAPVEALEVLLRSVQTGHLGREILSVLLGRIHEMVPFLISFCNAVIPPSPTASAATAGRPTYTRAEKWQLQVICDGLESCIPVWGPEMVEGFADAIGVPEWTPPKLRYITAIMAVLVIGTAPHELYIAEPWESESEPDTDSGPDTSDPVVFENEAERDGPVIEGLQQIREQDSESRWDGAEPTREARPYRYR